MKNGSRPKEIEIKEQCCVHCGATENLIEEGGQFTGYWLICGGCLLEQDIAHRKLMEAIEKFKLGVK